MTVERAPTEPERPALAGAPEDERRFALAGRPAFLLLLAAAAAVFAVFRADALSRARGPLIADGTEYVLLARHLVDGGALAVASVRSGFFALFLAAPLLAQRPFLEPGAVESVLGYHLVMLAFVLLALAGTYRLGARLAGPWAGLTGAFLLAVLPEATYWSSDFLTDAPAGACLVWSVVLLVERRPGLAGLALGAAVMLRYQSLISLAAVLAIPLARRDWRGLGRLLLGLVPPFLVLGVVDRLLWGTFFQSFLEFVPRQLTTFLPRELVEAVLPLESVRSLPEGGGAPALPVERRGWSWYVEAAPAFFRGSVLAGLALLLVARFRFRSRLAADAALWVAAATLLVLSAQRYKEPRYLLAIAPLVSALGGAGLVWLVAEGGRVLRLPRAVLAVLGPLLLAAVGAWHAAGCWEEQALRPYAPFGSVLAAAEAIPAAERPCLVAATPWILARDHPPSVVSRGVWRSRDVSVLHLKSVAPFLTAAPEDWPRMPGRQAMEAVDFFLVRPRSIDGEPGLLRYVNERTEYAGYFFDPEENDYPTLLLRTVREGARTAPFWDADDQRAREGEPAGRFLGTGPLEGYVLEAVGAEAERLPTAELAVRLDTRWRVPEREDVYLTVLVEVQDDARRVLGRETLTLVPGAPALAEGRRGAALRLSRYRTLTGEPATGRLHLLVSAIASSPTLGSRQELRPDGASRTADGRLRLGAPLR